MILGSDKYVRCIDLEAIPKIVINGTAIEYVTSAKNLGAVISHTLNWNEHVKLITRRAYGVLASLRFYRKSLSRELHKNLVQQLVFPHLNYIPAVYIHLDEERISKLRILQNSCVRFVIGFIPFIPTAAISSLTIWLYGSHLSVSDRGHSLLLCILRSPEIFQVTSCLLRQPLLMNLLFDAHAAFPPAAFEYRVPRTEAWNNSVSVSGQRLLNALSVTSFDTDRILQFKAWTRDVFLSIETAILLDQSVQGLTPEKVCRITHSFPVRLIELSSVITNSQLAQFPLPNCGFSPGHLLLVLNIYRLLTIALMNPLTF